MSSLLRPSLLAGVIGVVAFCVFGLCLAGSVIDLPALRPSAEMGQLRQETSRGEELEQLERATWGRVQARRQVVRQVIDRQSTLMEALEKLQQLNREWPNYYDKVPEVALEGSREEKSYRYILAEVEEMLRERPEELAAVLHRLKKDYQQLQARGL